MNRVPKSSQVIDVNPDFKDRSILITGCSSGIGYYAAKTLHDRGYQVYATTRKAADTELLSSHGIRTLQLDLDDSRSIENTVAVVLKETGGKLYGLFNNCLLYTSPSPRDGLLSRMPSSA